jgi:hypothetical protein
MPHGRPRKTPVQPDFDKAPEHWQTSCHPSNKPDCITEKRTAQGFWWRYTHSKDEPNETIEMAIRIAGEVAADEARKSGKTYVVALTPQPSPAVYVFR